MKPREPVEEETQAGSPEKPVIILPANEFKITEVLRHIESGAIVLIIPGNGQRAPPAE